MRADLYTKTILTVIAVLLGVLAFRTAGTPAVVRAQGIQRDLYIEPGVFMLRKPDGMAQVKGKVVIDRVTGEVWGFPTLVDGPYPVDQTKTTPPVSHPMYLGQFAFSDLGTR